MGKIVERKASFRNKVNDLDIKIAHIDTQLDYLIKTANNLVTMVTDGFKRMATKDDIAFLSKKLDLLEHGQERILLQLDSTFHRSKNKQAKI